VIHDILWVHAFEEDQAGDEVYRPATAPFPLSRRPREAFELHGDGSALVFRGGPDDRSMAHEATWSDTPRGIVVADKEAGVRYLIVEQTPRQLIVRRD
jgi:hypothetical protein